MLPSWKHGKNETKQPTVETEEVGNITGPWATVVNRKDAVPTLMGFAVRWGGIAHKRAIIRIHLTDRWGHIQGISKPDLNDYEGFAE